MDTTLKDFIQNHEYSKNIVCIPVHKSDSSNDFFISESFNSTSHFYLIDFKKKKLEICSNSEMTEKLKQSGGEGFKSIGISTIICFSISPMALKILNNSGIFVMQSKGSDILENLDLLVNNKITHISLGNPSLISSCSSSGCSSCDSDCH